MKVFVGKSGIHGQGVIAKQKIRRGETAFIIKGTIRKWKVVDQKSSLFGPNWVGIGKDTWIDTKGVAEFINHSCRPNAGIRGRVLVTALRDIEAGEEITMDYSITEIDHLWHMSCHCGATNCRKIVKSIEFLPKKVFNSYVPYVPTKFKEFYLSKTRLRKD